MRKDPALEIDLEVWGRILSIGTCGAIVGKFVGGWAADAFGGKRTFSVGLLCASVFVGLFAASTEIWMFQVTFFVTLLAKSAGWPAMAKRSTCLAKRSCSTNWLAWLISASQRGNVSCISCSIRLNSPLLKNHMRLIRPSTKLRMHINLAFDAAAVAP